MWKKYVCVCVCVDGGEVGRAARLRGREEEEEEVGIIKKKEVSH